jgi:hypothetical protein
MVTVGGRPKRLLNLAGLIEFQQQNEKYFQFCDETIKAFLSALYKKLFYLASQNRRVCSGNLWIHD